MCNESVPALDPGGICGDFVTINIATGTTFELSGGQMLLGVYIHTYMHTCAKAYSYIHTYTSVGELYDPRSG